MVGISGSAQGKCYLDCCWLIDIGLLARDTIIGLGLVAKSTQSIAVAFLNGVAK